MRVIPREVKRKKIVTWSKEIRGLQGRLSLSPHQKEILYGTLLGDGCLAANAYGKNYRLKIEHGKRQKKYVWWKYKIFKEWVLSPPRFQKRTNSWRFYTISHPEFKEFQKIFYGNGKKGLPKQIGEILKSPLSIAVWFMDDGGKMVDRKREYGYLLNIQQFSPQEVNRVQEALRKNFNLFTTQQWNNSGYRLYFGKKFRKKFDGIIRNYIIPCLKYKLLLTP
jgi:hypothetical protein